MNNKHLRFQISHFIRNNPTDTKVAFGECVDENYLVFENVTYKKGSVMIEESQQLEFAVEIARKGYLVSIFDCKEVIDSVKALYNNLFHYVEV